MPQTTMQLTCDGCGREFDRIATHARRNFAKSNRVFCSRVCSNRASSLDRGECEGCGGSKTINTRYNRDCSVCVKRVQEYGKNRRKLKHDRGECQVCPMPVGRNQKFCPPHAAERNARVIAANRAVKVECFTAYGGCSCACCGETRLEFLTLDHSNNDGADHRREMFGKSAGKGGAPMYRKLRNAGFPDLGLRVLCFNCNVSRGFIGQCPHERERRQPVPFSQFGVLSCIC